ncbi:Hint domain-containing protein [Nioella sp.]|uniref:Hint domain-containing protein n=1 Tax=Nioella sp. TaxID=1912091 RepID=UPI003A878A8A
MFNYFEHALFSLAGSFLGYSAALGWIPDEDGDGQFETGDTDTGGNWGGFSPTEFGAFVGTVIMVNSLLQNVVLPVFQAASGYRVLNPYPEPITFPSTLPAINAGASFAFCFAEGTMISTPSGETAVEALRIGEDVLTADGRAVQVRWIGQQTLFPRFAPAARLRPVRIAAGALGDGQPRSDLTVTADHGMLVEGVICHAGALVNGTTITRVPLAEMGESYTVYHIETEAHEIILANGAPAETFIDNVSRRVFDNFAEFEALYGDVPEMEELPYPRAMSARQVPERLKAKLAGQRAA